MKTLIIYYSLTDNTKHSTQKLAQTLNADTLELKPQKEISKGLMRFIWGGRQVYMKTKPKLQ